MVSILVLCNLHFGPLVVLVHCWTGFVARYVRTCSPTIHPTPAPTHNLPTKHATFYVHLLSCYNMLS